VARRQGPGLELVQEAEAVAATSRAMAERFAHGGRLFAFGNDLAATDARHIAVEFLHPVIVGKRALPAIALTGDAAVLTGLAGVHGLVEIYARQLECLARPADIALGLSAGGACANVLRALEAAKAMGMLTVALAGGGVRTPIALSDAVDHPIVLSADDPLIVKEAHVTTYHLLWELTLLFIEQVDGRPAASRESP